MLCGIRSSNGVTRMSASTAVRSHYAKGGLTDRIAAALHDSGIDVANVTVDDLGRSTSSTPAAGHPPCTCSRTWT